MTNGIIQQVFEKYHTRLNLAKTHNDMLFYIQKIQQELIENIKQEFPHSRLVRPDVQDKLIGDNKND